MDTTDLKASTLLLGMMGVVLIFVGVVLYANIDRFQAYAHLLTPLPPISIAAYIYAVHRFRPLIHEDVTRPVLMATAKDLLAEFVVGGVAFLVISGLLLGIVILWHSVSR
jgi:hypothetical protein